MSRGNGVIQNAILRAVYESAAPVTFESLRWTLFPILKGSPHPKQLPTRWNTAFSRSLNVLASASQPQIVIDRRPLADFPECVAHFPSKTLNSKIRDLRLNLLPAFAELIASGRLTPRYGAAANEKYHVAAENARLQEIQREWIGLAKAIIPIFGQIREDALFVLIAKGKELFEKSAVSNERDSFIGTIAGARKFLPAALAGRLDEFGRRFLPPDDAGHLRLKSYIYGIARFSGSGVRYTLTPRAIEHLYEARRSYLESLDGFTPSKFPYSAPEHSDLLNRLFDKTAFQNFQFVRRAA
jgi:hypothetical protein